MRSKEYRALLDIQSFISKHSFERNRDEMENLGKCLMILDKTIREFEFIKNKIENVKKAPLKALENIKREAGTPYFSTLYDIDMWREDFATIENTLKALEIIKEVYTND